MEKYYQCGRDSSPLNEDTIDSLRNSRRFAQIQSVLGTPLFIEWLYITDFISFAEYKKIRVHALNPYNYR
tara:strand:+ start:201 stop:410 length:210 start_codon:yes stop_codon:yes gene_type:complete